jgi:hypothetical protein
VFGKSLRSQLRKFVLNLTERCVVPRHELLPPYQAGSASSTTTKLTSLFNPSIMPSYWQAFREAPVASAIHGGHVLCKKLLRCRNRLWTMAAAAAERHAWRRESQRKNSRWRAQKIQIHYQTSVQTTDYSSVISQIADSVPTDSNGDCDKWRSVLCRFYFFRQVP